MNILLSMPSDNQSNTYLINAFQDLKHNVFFFDHRRFLKECIESVPEIIKTQKIDLVLVLYLVNNQTYPADYIKMLKGRFPNVKYVSWIFDATIDGILCSENKNFIELIKEYDYFFTVCRGQVETFRKKEVNAFFLPEGCDRYTHNLTEYFDKIYDVTFIGQVGHPVVHKERFPLMKQIISRYSNTKIWGPCFAQDEDIFNHHAKRPTFNDVEHSRIVAQSKINIGHSGWPEIDGYFSARNYRIMAAGGFLMANHSLNIEEFYEPNKEIVLYEDAKDCLEKIKFYLKNEDLRNEIAGSGNFRTISSYTFNNRIFDMLRITE